MGDEPIFIRATNDAEARVLEYFDELQEGLDGIKQMAEFHRVYGGEADNVEKLREYCEVASSLLTLIVHSAEWLKEERDILTDLITFTK